MASNQNFINSLLIKFYRVMYFYCYLYNNVLTENDRKKQLNDFIMYKLMKDYGIKRKVIGDDIYLLSYDKKSEIFNENLTESNMFILLCKHFVIDMNSAAVLSLGNVKAYYQFDNINEFNAQFTGDFNDYRIEVLEPGTMIIYNKKLSKEPRLSDTECDPTISTRKKIGTSHFNFNDSFSDYFRKINDLIGFQEDKLNDNKCYVFNCKVPGEHLTLTSECKNSLIDCYTFKSVEDSRNTHLKLMDLIKLVPKDIELNNPDDLNEIDGFEQLLNELVSDMITVHNVNEEVLSLQKTGAGMMNIPDELHFQNLSELNEYVKYKEKNVEKGITVYNKDGRRVNYKYKFYTELEELRGNLPLNINTESNNENLFKIYWKLASSGKCEKFFAYFDSNEMYKKLFYQFGNDMEQLSINLFKTYHKAYVKKTLPKDKIYYYLKNLCYKLHGFYLNNREDNIITPEVTLQFIRNLDVNQVYWLCMMLIDIQMM